MRLLCVELEQRLRRGSGRRFAPSCATAAALPARLPTNCPAASLRSLQDSSPWDNCFCSGGCSGVKSQTNSTAAGFVEMEILLCVTASPREPVTAFRMTTCVTSPPGCTGTVRLRRFAPCWTVRPGTTKRSTSKAAGRSARTTQAKSKAAAGAPALHRRLSTQGQQIPPPPSLTLRFRRNDNSLVLRSG